MNLRLALAAIHLPVAVRRRALADLARRTARAFEAPAPELAGASLDEMLRDFARFTRAQADRFAASPGAAARARIRLRQEAREFGATLRGRLGVSSPAEAMRAARLLYRAIGVDLSASLAGSIVVRSCAFSAAYTCDTCAFMSAMDEGLFAGLAGEGRLEFTTRITEGSGCCVAFFTFEEPRP